MHSGTRASPRRDAPGRGGARGVATLTAFVALFAVTVGPQPALAQSTMHRCTDADGKVTLQQLPCATSAQSETLPLREVPVTEMGDNIRALAHRNASGAMTEDEMLARLGRPSATNTDVFGDTVRRQHVYRYPDGSARYVYTRDGMVVGVQERQAIHRPAPQPCHSAAELRSAQIDASSIRLNDEQRQAAERRVAEMQACRR